MWEEDLWQGPPAIQDSLDVTIDKGVIVAFWFGLESAWLFYLGYGGAEASWPKCRQSRGLVTCIGGSQVPVAGKSEVFQTETAGRLVLQ